MYFIKLKVVPTVFAVVLSLWANMALAQDDSATVQPTPSVARPWYVGVKYADLSYKTEGLIAAAQRELGSNITSYRLSDTTDVSGVMFQLRRQLKPNFGVEARAMLLGADGTAGEIDGVSLKLEIDSYLGLFGRLSLPAKNKIEPYFLLGFGQIKSGSVLTGHPRLVGIKETDTDIGYGIGVNFKVTPEVDIHLEYMNYYNEDLFGNGTVTDVTISGLGLGLEFRF